jgi:hypothetical protein
LRHHTAAKTASLISILHRSNFSTKITMFDQLVTPRKILPQHHGKHRCDVASRKRCGLQIVVMSNVPVEFEGMLH